MSWLVCASWISFSVSRRHRAQNGLPQGAQLFATATFTFWGTTFCYEASVINPIHAKDAHSENHTGRVADG